MRRPWEENGTKRKKLPVFLSTHEVRSLLSVIGNLKHRAILTTVYSWGLRPGGATHLEVSDIDSRRKVIRVQGSKGNRDRYTLFGERTLQTLPAHSKWPCHREIRPFPGGKKRYSIFK